MRRPCAQKKKEGERGYVKIQKWGMMFTKGETYRRKREGMFGNNGINWIH